MQYNGKTCKTFEDFKKRHEELHGEPPVRVQRAVGRQKTGIPPGLSKNDYLREWRKRNRKRINSYWKKWWSENGQINPSRKKLSATCRVAAGVVQNKTLAADLLDAAKVLEYVETQGPPNAPDERPGANTKDSKHG